MGELVDTCPECGAQGGDLPFVKHLSGSTDYWYQFECRKCRWWGMYAAPERRKAEGADDG